MTSQKPSQPALPGVPKPKKAPAGPKKPMPKWMLDQIKAEHPESFGHRVHWGNCHRCGAWILTGHDWTEDFAGDAAVDPSGLDTMTELAALVARRRTYELATDGDDLVLRSRDQWRIGAHAPESLAGPVMPAHQCNNPLGVPLPRDVLKERTMP